MKKSKKKKTIGDLIWRVVFLAALVVFCYCAFQLITIYLEYKKGTDEYSSLEQKYVSEDMFTENETGVPPVAKTAEKQTKTEHLFPLRRMLPGQRTIPKAKRPKIRQTSRKNLIRQERPRQRSKRMKKGRPR